MAGRTDRLVRALVIAGVAVLASAQAGCAAPGEPESAAALRARFSEQASRVLDEGEELVASESGFTVAQAETSSGTNRGVERRGGLALVLPQRADDAIRVSLPGGFAATVHEEGASGEGAITGHAVAYPRENGTAFWTAVSNGYEEWLHVAPGLAKRNRTIAAWTVEGAVVEKRADVVVLLDAEGVPRVTVTAPAAYAADGKQVEAKLAVREQRIELSVDAGGQEVLVDPLWTTAGSVGRVYHTTTLLPDGRALAVGGVTEYYGGSVPLTTLTTELFDPTSNTWSPAASLPGPYWVAPVYHTATWLPEVGDVLIAGGTPDFNGPSAFAFLYHAASGTWSMAPPMGVGRLFHTATRLKDGRVLMVGGLFFSNADNASAEIYDPATGTFSPVASPGAPRSFHTATLLADGRVLVAGGSYVDAFGSDQSASAELYDPQTDAWSPAGSMSFARTGHRATRLAGGRVLVVGGWDNGSNSALASAEIYDPVTNLWSTASSMALGRFDHTVTSLHNGTVLVSGGLDSLAFLDSPDPSVLVEVYNPVTDTWAPAGAGVDPYVVAGQGGSATRLQNGDVLLTGGILIDDGDASTWSASASSVLYTPSAPMCVTIQRGVSGVVEDTYVGSDQPDENHGGEAGILIGGAGAGERQGLVRFDLAGIPAGVLVMSAKVTLTGKTSAPATVRAHRVLTPWSEPALTWSGLAGGYDPLVLASFASTGSSHVFDISHEVQAWIDQEQPNDGLLFEQDPGSQTRFASSEASNQAQRPKLEVCYVVP